MVPIFSRLSEHKINANDTFIESGDFGCCVLSLQQQGHQDALEELRNESSRAQQSNLVYFSRRDQTDVSAREQSALATQGH